MRPPFGIASMGVGPWVGGVRPGWDGTPLGQPAKEEPRQGAGLMVFLATSDVITISRLLTNTHPLLLGWFDAGLLSDGEHFGGADGFGNVVVGEERGFELGRDDLDVGGCRDGLEEGGDGLRDARVGVVLASEDGCAVAGGGLHEGAAVVVVPVGVREFGLGGVREAGVEAVVGALPEAHGGLGVTGPLVGLEFSEDSAVVDDA